MMSTCMGLFISHLEVFPESFFMQVLGIGVASGELYFGCNFSKLIKSQ